MKACPFSVANVVNRADVGMIEGGGGLGLTSESCQRLGISGHFIRQKFERDMKRRRLGVLGLVDDAHAAATQFFQNR